LSPMYTCKNVPGFIAAIKGWLSEIPENLLGVELKNCVTGVQNNESEIFDLLYSIIVQRIDEIIDNTNAKEASIEIVNMDNRVRVLIKDNRTNDFVRSRFLESELTEFKLKLKTFNGSMHFFRNEFEFAQEVIIG
jgi:hypothetical protein